MNIIKCGDSRELLRTLEDESVQCVYFDPPFNSNRNYYLTPDNKLGFEDKFKSSEDYISLVEPMVKECLRVLKKDGSFFFHVSADQMFIPHLLCNKHFKRVQPIFWQRSRSKNNIKTKLGACTDVIFWCSKSKKPKFNMVYQPLDDFYSKNSYKNKDQRGNFALGHIVYTKTQATKNKERLYSITHKGVVYQPKSGWRLSKPDLESLIKEDRVYFPTKKAGANPYKKIYKHESKGKPSTDYWDDIHSIAMGSEERIYPTQKPIALLDRIIEMSTSEGDIILDPVAGSGTTGLSALNLRRGYILFDLNPEAVILMKQRLKGGK